MVLGLVSWVVIGFVSHHFEKGRTGPCLVRWRRRRHRVQKTRRKGRVELSETPGRMTVRERRLAGEVHDG